MFVMMMVKNYEWVYKNKVVEEVCVIEVVKFGDFGVIYYLVRGENYRVSF